jgi:lysyl-tRNA synthetase class 1
MFWTEERAQKVEQRHAAPYVVSDWKTPSGHIHVGSLRGVLVHDAVARALKLNGHEVRYVYGFDDADPFDKLPKYLDQNAYQQFLGMPMREVPVPDAAGAPDGLPITREHNYARHYADEFEAVYRQLGVESTTIYKADLYDQGEFNEAIRLVLDNAAEVGEAFKAVVQDRSADRIDKKLVADFPLNVRCEQCGKLATTTISAWDGNEVTYSCQSGVVAWAEGCGHSGHVSPYNGRAKLPWKVDWAASWFVLQSDIEGAGKDHYTKGGSRDVSLEIFRRIFAPAAAVGHQQSPEDLFYEWLYEDGKKMSTSKAVGAKAGEVLADIPAELLRFMMIRIQPRSGVEFRRSSALLPQLFDEFDRIVQGANDGEERASTLLSAVKFSPHVAPTVSPLRFSTITSLIQIHKIDIAGWAAQELDRALDNNEKAELDRRVVLAKQWLDTYPDERLYSLLDTTPKLALSDTEKQYISSVTQSLEQLPDWTGIAIQQVLYEQSKIYEIPTKHCFELIYKLFLGQSSGPRAGLLLAQLEKSMVLGRLREAQ